MAFFSKPPVRTAFLCLFLLLSVSCGKPRHVARPERLPVIPTLEEDESQMTTEPGETPAVEVALKSGEVASRELVPVETPTVSQALVTFLSGEVNHAANGDWETLEIGQAVARKETVRVGPDSYCELQFGDVGALRIQSNTQVLLSDVLLEPGRSAVGVELTVGSVLAKVSKLSGDDRFQVKTATAVCGVRGTQFGVTVSRSGKTRLAVKEGRVAVLPASVDLNQVKAKVQDEQAVLAVARIEQSAPLVAADQELVIGQETLQQTEAAFRAVEQKVEEIARREQSGQPLGAAEKARLLEELDNRAERTVQRVAAAIAPPQAISQESVRELAPIEQMRLVQLPAPVETPAQAPAGAAETGAAATPTVQPEKVGFTVQPPDAEIVIDGTPVGRGTFSGLYAPGETIEVLFRRGGYVERRLTVRVARGASRQYAITLKEQIVPVEITLHSSPEDARILVDGTEVGTGRYTGTWPSGTRLAVRMERDGWLPGEFSIEVSKDGEKAFDLVLERPKRAVTVKALPADATISLAGKPVGTGRFSGEYPAGERLTFQVTRAGYASRTLPVEVAEGGSALEVRLERETREILIHTNPPDAVITRGSQVLARGRYTGRFAVGEALSFQISRAGYVARILNLSVPEQNRRTFRVDLTEESREISLTTRPADAEILLDGEKVGQGSLTRSFPLSRTLSFVVRRPGYQEQALTVPVARAQGSPYTVTLQGLPVQWRRGVFESAAVRGLVATPEGAVAADARGNLTAVGRRGEPSWTIATRNQPNENSTPVRIGNNVYFSGADEFIIANAANGNVITRMSLDAPFSHIFGRRVVPFGSFAVFPADDVLRLINLYSGETLREIPVPDGTRMTPAVYNGKLLIVSQQGVFLIIDPQSGGVEVQIPTGAAQPVALAPTVHGSQAFFADRKGLIVAVDLAGRRVSWEVPLPRDQEAGSGVFQDLAAGPHGVFAWARGTLFGFSRETGAPLFAPIGGVSSPPLYRAEEGLLVFGSRDGMLVLADPSGQVRRRLDLKAVVTAQPAWSDGLLLLGTQDGELIQVNPAFIQ